MVEEQKSFQPLLVLQHQPEVVEGVYLCQQGKTAPWSYKYIKIPFGNTGVLTVKERDIPPYSERVMLGCILKPGEYVAGKCEDVVIIDTSQKLFDEKYNPETNEGIPTTVEVRMYYNLRPEYAPEFYKTYNSKDFENVLLRPCLHVCVDNVVGGVSINSFSTKVQAEKEVGEPLQQLIKEMANGIGMDYTNLHVSFSPPRWRRELAEITASQQVNAGIAEMRRQILLLDGTIEAEIDKKKHEANQPTETELELAKIQAGATELREKLSLLQELFVNFVSRQNNP